MTDSPPNEEPETTPEQILPLEKLSPEQRRELSRLDFFHTLEKSFWEYVRARYKWLIGLGTTLLTIIIAMGSCSVSYIADSLIQRTVDTKLEKQNSKLNAQSARLEEQIAKVIEARIQAAIAADAATDLVERADNRLAEVDKKADDLFRKLVREFDIATTDLVERVDNRLAEVDRKADDLFRKLVREFDIREDRLKEYIVETRRIQTLLDEAKPYLERLTKPLESTWDPDCLNRCAEDHPDLGPEFIVCKRKCDSTSNQE